MTDWFATSNSTESVAGLEASQNSSLDATSRVDEQSAFEAARRWRVCRLEEIEAKIAELQEQREKFSKEVAALDGLLGYEEHSYTEPTPGTIGNSKGRTDDLLDPISVDGDSTETRHSPAHVESVDATLKVLQQHGRPLHYREIYDKVTDMGVSVIGKDPAAVLLARFSRDSRIQRVGSGTYTLITDIASIS